ncbi:MAG TPA: trigger factor, partial [Thermodesulfovibrionales bacterium]|nr:trigger factor [Thermodesulfovibrionales bacterium]
MAIVEDISSTKKRLKIEIPADILEKEYSDSLNKIRQRARIPGFRQGKTPINIIEKKFGHEIKSEMLEKLVPTYYAQAVKDADLSPVTMPKIEEGLDFKRNEPLSFSLTIEVRPKIDKLNYTGIKVKDIAVSVDDKEIEDTVKGLQNDRAMFEAVEREIREDDLLVIDYAKLDPAGEKELSTAKDQIMNLGNRLTPRGILDAVLGRKKGETVEVSLPEMEGKEINEESEKGNKLRITIKEVKEKKLPELDDEFAKDFGHETFEKLKEKIREGILAAKQENARKHQKAEIVDALIGAHEFDVPESLTEAELEHLIASEKTADKNMQHGEPSAPEAKNEELSQVLRPKAVKNVKGTIILDEVAEKENITVSEAEVKDRISLIAKQLQATPDAIVNLFMTRDGSLDNLRHKIREEKVLDL